MILCLNSLLIVQYISRCHRYLFIRHIFEDSILCMCLDQFFWMKMANRCSMRSENFDPLHPSHSMVSNVLPSLNILTSLQYFSCRANRDLEGPVLICECGSSFFTGRLTYSVKKGDYRFTTDTIPFPSWLPPKRKLIHIGHSGEDQIHTDRSPQNQRMPHGYDS